MIPPTSSRRLPAIVTILVALAFVATGCVTPPAQAGDRYDITRALDRVLHTWQQRGPVPAAAMAVSTRGQPVWVGTAGTTVRDGSEPVRPDTRFPVASITKTFVATVVLQLVEEGTLALDDHLDAHVAAFPGGQHVTIRQLLNHSSGIPDYERAEGLGEQLLGQRERRWTTDDVLGLVAGRRRSFAPGDGYEYSNTNYVLLAEVIRSATGVPWALQVRERILDPLALRDTFIPGMEHVPTGGRLAGYFDADNDGDTEDVWDRPWPALETLEGPAGAMVSTATDLTRFMQALFGGELLESGSLAHMVQPGPAQPRVAKYGLGVEILWPDRETLVWGHGGFLPGFRSVMWYVPDRELSIVVLANESRANPYDLAEIALRTIDRAARRRADAGSTTGA